MEGKIGSTSRLTFRGEGGEENAGTAERKRDKADREAVIEISELELEV